MALSIKDKRAPVVYAPPAPPTAPSRHVAVCTICEGYAGEATPGVAMAEQYRAPWAANGIHRGQTCTHSTADWLMCTEAEAEALVKQASRRAWATARVTYTGLVVPQGADRGPQMRTHGGARYVATGPRLPRPGDRPERPVAERKVPGGVVRRTLPR